LTKKEDSMGNMEVTPGLTDALLMLADGPKEIPNDALNIIARFVIVLFDRTSTFTKVDHARGIYFHGQKLGAAKHAYPSCSRGASPKSSPSRWSHMGEDNATRPCVVITN